jgi:hypothetical protein
MNDSVLAAIIAVLGLPALHYASKLLARVTGRAMSGRPANLRSFTVSFALMLGGIALVSAVVPSSKPLKYVAYGVVIGIANLISRLLFRSGESNVSESTSSHQKPRL